jgi:transcriptional regulator with XRE-family HTH domain
MKISKSAIRNGHFLGTKVRNLRKRNNLTMEDLSARCIKIDAETAPSVSYISMIERGKRVPSIAMLETIAEVFQREPEFFLDNSDDEKDLIPVKPNRGGLTGMALEPSFLFSGDILQIAIPELLSQSGVSGREFAHLLIRAYQEHHQNQFPELERAAEEVGLKQAPMMLEDVMAICKRLALSIHWFKDSDKRIECELGGKAITRSYFEAPNKIFVNEALKAQPNRLKYDLAVHIGHRVLHGSNGVSSVVRAAKSQVLPAERGDTASMHAQDILRAWRDFECSHFAGALLCPRGPFRRALDQLSHEVRIADMFHVTEGVAMRRMSAVSNYKHWHYFDAYPPGRLKAVYRGNGIPLPWGNMRMVDDPCQHWAVFRMLDTKGQASASQISVLNADDGPHLYACHSVIVSDLAGNSHVLCAGVDINPALEAQSLDAKEIADQVQRDCQKKGGSATLRSSVKAELKSVAKILNMAWMEQGLDREALLICRRSSQCPRNPKCKS